MGNTGRPGASNTSEQGYQRLSRGEIPLEEEDFSWIRALTGSAESSSGDSMNFAPSAFREAALKHNLQAWAEEEEQGEAEDRREAVTRIEAWLENRRGWLDLTSLALTALPPLPVGLRRLNTSDNELTRLPELLPAGLERLTAAGNRLTRLPEVLPAALERLTAGDNQLTRLPNTLPPGLKSLDANNNRLTSLPDTLPPGLEVLAVNNNELAQLPETLPPNLRKLYANKNELTELPEVLPPQLRELCASHNELTRLPENLPVGMERLEVPNNALTHLPPRLPTGLRALNVGSNELKGLGNAETALPYILERLSSECEVELSKNQISERMRTHLMERSGAKFPRIRM
ncbi:hypothetical protein [Mesorhizobium sp. L-2-11]|uniref:hypothetical protein n=1 Tax=Mesorhizobium sp. L-2-11 TaxID=2744521 RepID=UPI0019368909|nr:hypothetical protein [Mesorhizobium sp. L-2-11]BCH19727.1 hypothetical protein MesoLjLa_65780 [Mesorhizobium sp. L-2-11]